MQNWRAFVYWKFWAWTGKVENHLVISGESVELGHVEVVTTIFRAFFLVVGVKVFRAVDLPLWTFLHANLQRLLDFFQVKEEHIRLVESADAGNIPGKVCLAELLIRSDSARVSERIVAVDYAKRVSVDKCKARDDDLKF